MYEYLGQKVYIRPSYVVSLPHYDSPTYLYSLPRLENQKNLRENFHNGTLSGKALKNLRNVINWLLLSAENKDCYCKKNNFWFKFKVNFVTLTLPDTSFEVTNKFFQERLMNPFLTNLRKNHRLKNYVWKLELQKNGKLHVHFTTDTFIHWRKLRTAWNSILKTAGCIEDFKKKFGHDDPNSTDVHSVRSIRNLAGYLVKYMCKSDAGLKKVTGRIWGCSRILSECLNCMVEIVPGECATAHASLTCPTIRRTEILGKPDQWGTRKCIGEIFLLNAVHWVRTITGTLLDKFADTISFIRGSGCTEDQLAYYEV